VSGAVSLNDASYEELRELGLSVTQTGRVLSHRERTGGFSSLEELEQIPGFPQDFLSKLKGRLSL
jgi:DNA uptake protein ComE-like DNA-binding protein